MNKLKTNTYYLIWKNWLIRIFSLFASILSFLIFIMIYFKQYKSIFYIFLSLLAIAIIFEIIYLFLFDTTRKKLIAEQWEVVNKTKLPEKLPKVVFLYPTHNDFKPKCLEQSMKQTYKNFEVWISDGSDKKACSDEIDKFAIKHKINVFRLGGKGSINKADTMNKFLKYSGVNFDYLLICDADEIINEHFVEYSLKLFNSDKFINIGYISSAHRLYTNKSLYSGLTSLTEKMWTNNFINKSFVEDHVNPFYSSCSLIKKELLNNANNSFPNSILEDCVFEKFSTYLNMPGFLLSIIPSYQQADLTFLQHMNRILRIHYGAINEETNYCYNLENIWYKDYYSKKKTLLFLYLVPIIFILTSTLLVWIIHYNFNYLWNNFDKYWMYLVSSCCFIVINLFFGSFLLKKYVKINIFSYYLNIIANGMFWVTIVMECFKNDWKFIFFRKKEKKWNIKKKINLLSAIMWFFLLSIIIVGWNLCVIYFMHFMISGFWWSMLFFLVNISLALFIFNYFCIIILTLISKFPTKEINYDRVITEFKNQKSTKDNRLKI